MPRETIAIRGLDPNLYHQLFSMAKKDGKRVADLMNEALRKQLRILGGNPNPSDNPGLGPAIENAGSITLSRMVISNLHHEMGKFSIKNSGKLTLDRDIDIHSLGYIERIVNTSSGVIRVPKSIYHMIILKSKNHGALEMY